MSIRNIANVSLCLALLSVGNGVAAQNESRWHNVDINQQNREPRRAAFFAYETLDKAQSFDKKKSANYLSMEGMWKFNFVKDHNKRPANFFAANYDDSEWKDFPVPGLFELNGYGDATYKNVGYAWATQFDPNPPYISELNNYTGSYRRTFELPKDWKGKDVYFHVGSATSNLTLWVNGKYVGYSEDSKVAAEFNISKYLKPGKNLIAMQVMRWCDGSYFEDQDFWRFTGIAREVYLYARPKLHAADIRLDAGLMNNYRDGILNYQIALKGGKTDVTVALCDKDGKQISLGICNGCQLMVELNLINPEHKHRSHLCHNTSKKFESTFLGLTIPQNDSVMFGSLSGDKLGIWVAHGEGRFYLPEPEDHYNIIAKYNYAEYPGNPNGSDYNVAGICSADGRHLAMMPHLERAIFPWQNAWYPADRRNDEVTPWIEAFVNARQWIEERALKK